MHRKSISTKITSNLEKKCCNCGSTENIEYHHIVPLVLGGNDVISNVCCLCHTCHYKLHHNGKLDTFDHGELIKIGQAKSNKKIGKAGSTIKVIRVVDGLEKEEEYQSPKCLAEQLNISRRTVEYWCYEHRYNHSRAYRKYGIKEIYIKDQAHGEKDFKIMYSENMGDVQYKTIRMGD